MTPGYNADNSKLRTLRSRSLDTPRRLASLYSNRWRLLLKDLVGPSYPYLAYLKIVSLANIGPYGQELLVLRGHDEIFRCYSTYPAAAAGAAMGSTQECPERAQFIKYHELHTKNRSNTYYVCVIFKRCKSQTNLAHLSSACSLVFFIPF